MDGGVVGVTNCVIGWVISQCRPEQERADGWQGVGAVHRPGVVVVV